MSTESAPVTEPSSCPSYRLQKMAGHRESIQHATFESAQAEAERLVGLLPDATFCILHEVARVRAVSPNKRKAA